MNYLLSHNPFITITTNLHFYSAVGGHNTIPSTNENLGFYISAMFQYGLFQAVKKAISSGNVSGIINILNPSYFVPNSMFGFYMYAFFLASIYLLAKREKSAYVPLFWFLFCFGYLEFGPMHISIKPFEYLLSYRLQRFLTIIAPPVSLTLGFGIVKSIEKQKGKEKPIAKAKRIIAALFSTLGVLFLLYSSYLINNFWYGTFVASRYDQLMIAKYLIALPNSTKIYFSGFASMIPVYMKFENLSRFISYDSIKNCSSIPSGSYVVIPYFKLFNISFTPNPEKYCKDWVEVYAPVPNYLPKEFKNLSATIAYPFEAKLYYVEQSASTSGFDFFNLTGVGITNSSSTSFILVNNVDKVETFLNKSVASPGERVLLNVTYVGNFLWGNSTPTYEDAAKYYLSSNLVNIHYFGFELPNQSGMLAVQNGRNWEGYLNVGEPHQVLDANYSHYFFCSMEHNPKLHCKRKNAENMWRILCYIYEHDA
ncbi:MAG: hypothetical protein QXL16_02065 [Candidatus Micrarchaeaceae archaeon]